MYLIQTICTAIDFQRKKKSRMAMVRASPGSGGSTQPALVVEEEDRRGKMLCNNFYRGQCNKGAECLYMHDKQAVAKAKAKAKAKAAARGNPGEEKETGANANAKAKAEAKAAPSPTTQLPCRGFAAGNCRFGDACQY